MFKFLLDFLLATTLLHIKLNPENDVYMVSSSTGIYF